MHKIILLLLITISPLHAKLLVYSSIAPVEFLVNEIGGEEIESRVLIAEGKDPHTFTPRLKMISELNKSALFFHVNAPFEKQIIKRIGKAEVIDLSANIKKKDGHHHGHQNKDPHIWLSPSNVKVMAKEIARQLSKSIPKKSKIIRQNLQRLLNKVTAIDKNNKKILLPYKGQKVLVFHPAFEYFLDSYGLIQVAIEHGGKEASPKRLHKLIKQAKENRVKVIFTQPQFNPKAAKAMARELGAEIKGINPLASNLLNNLKVMAKTISKAFKK